VRRQRNKPHTEARGHGGERGCLSSPPRGRPPLRIGHIHEGQAPAWRVRVAGRSAGRDEGGGDQDHEPTALPTRFVILISLALVPRDARQHEHAAPGAWNSLM